MATTQSKINKLRNADFGTKGSPNLMFPSDLVNLGQDGTCLTLFFNTIKNGAAKITFNGGYSDSKNALTSAYGEIPVIHTASRGLQQDNEGVKVFSDTFVRSNQSITLPMPKNLGFNQVVNWSKQELGTAAMAIDQGSDFSQLMESDKVATAGLIGLNTIGSIAKQFGMKNAADVVELGTASVKNNYAETLFKSVDNRTFSWSWVLTPRNEKEAETIDNMLRMLRFHQLPEFRENIGNGNAFLLYPSSVDVVFWLDGAPNQYVPRISTCAIQNLSTDYTSNGGFIRMVNGSPASYTLSITLMELSTMHKALVGTDEESYGTTF